MEFPTPDNSKQVVSAVKASFVGDLNRILSEEALGRYEDQIREILCASGGRADSLATYLFERLPEENSRPDRALATGFLVLSEMQDVSMQLRDLATDAMVYCEEDDDSLVLRRRPQLIKAFSELSGRAAA